MESMEHLKIVGAFYWDRRRELPAGRRGMERLRLFSRAVLVSALLFAAAPARAQLDLGHKIMGGIGIRAGFQPDAGVYLADKFISYRSDRLIDREGRTIPIEGLDVDAFGNAIGLSGTRKLAGHGVYLNGAIGVP